MTFGRDDGRSVTVGVGLNARLRHYGLTGPIVYNVG